jgi:autotransporter translocation and assembly factor TamB
MVIEKTSTLKRFFRRLIVISLILLGLFLTGLLLLALPPGEKLLREFVEEQLSQTLGYSVEIGELETDVFLHIRANQVKIFPVEGARDKPLFQLRSARLEYRLWEILNRNPRIKSLTLDSLYIKIRRDSSGVYQLPPALSEAPGADEDSSSNSFFARVEKLALINITFDYEDDFIPLKGKLVDLNIEIQAHPHSPGKDDYLLQMRVDSCYVAYLNKPLSTRNIDLKAGLVDQTLEVDTILGILPGFELGGKGYINLASHPYQIDGKLHGFGSPQKLWQTFRKDIYPSLNTLEGEIDFNLVLNGTLDNPVIALNITSPNLQVEDIVVQNSSINARYQNGQVLVDNLQLGLFDGVLAGKGEVSLDSLLAHRFELSVEELNFQKIWQAGFGEQLPYQGKISGRLMSQGFLLSLEEVQTSLNLAIHDLSYKFRSLADFETAVTLQNGTAHLNCQWGETSFLTNVNIQNQKLRGNFTAEVPEMASFADLFGLNDLSGSASVNGTVTGTLQTPELDIDVSGSNVRYWNFPVDTINGHLIFRDNQLLIAESFFSGSIAEIGTLRPPFDLSGWKGGFSYTAQLRGPFNKPQGNLSVKFFQPEFMEYLFDKGNLHLILNDNIININLLQLYKNDYAINVSGDYSIPANLIRGKVQLLPTTPHGISSSAGKSANTIFFHYDFTDSTRWNLDVKGKNVDLNIINSLGSFAEEMAGKSNFDLKWNGNLHDPRIRGQFDISDGEIRFNPDAKPLQNFATRLTVIDSTIQMKDISGMVDNIPFRLTGEIINTEEKRFFVKMNLAMKDVSILDGSGTLTQDSIDYQFNIQKLNLSLFQPFIAELKQLGGNLDTKLLLQGAINEPDIVGNLSIKDFRIQHEQMPSPLNSGIVQLDFNDNHIYLDTLFLKLNDGSIAVSGNMTHQLGELTDLELQVNAQNLKFEVPDTFTINLNYAQLFYQTQDGLNYLEGDIAPGDSRLLYKVNTKDYLKLAKDQFIATLQGPSEKPLDLLSFMKENFSSQNNLPPPLQKTRLNLRLRDSDSLWVDNNITKMRMDAELSLEGSLGSPTLTGRLNVLEGQVKFLDRNFDITQGILDFDDPARANPLLNIEAETKSKPLQKVADEEYDIVLKIFGPLDDFDYLLSSTPELEQADIISLLTLGVTSQHLESQGDQFTMNDALQERMKVIVSEEVSGRITYFTTEFLGKYLGLDELGVTGNLFDLSEARLLASKKLADRLEFKYTTSFKELKNYEFQANYRLLKYIFLEGKTNQKNESDANVKFRLKFK